MNWSTERVDARTGRRGSERIMKNRPGPRGNVRTVRTPLEAWMLFITPEILGKVVNHTNNTIAKFRERFADVLDKGKSDQANKYTHCGKTDLMEVHAFIGLMYLRGVLRQNLLSRDAI